MIVWRVVAGACGLVLVGLAAIKMLEFPHLTDTQFILLYKYWYLGACFLGGESLRRLEGYYGGLDIK